MTRHVGLGGTELEEILNLPSSVSLESLDNTLRMVISLFSTSHGKLATRSRSLDVFLSYPYTFSIFGSNRRLILILILILINAPIPTCVDKYMASPGESAHAYHLVLRSDLFRYHSERMINLILAEAEEVCLRRPTLPVPFRWLTMLDR